MACVQNFWNWRSYDCLHKAAVLFKIKKSKPKKVYLCDNSLLWDWRKALWNLLNNPQILLYVLRIVCLPVGLETKDKKIWTELANPNILDNIIRESYCLKNLNYCYTSKLSNSFRFIETSSICLIYPVPTIIFIQSNTATHHLTTHLFSDTQLMMSSLLKGIPFLSLNLISATDQNTLLEELTFSKTA